MCYHRWSTEKKSVTLAALVEQNVLPFFAPYQNWKKYVEILSGKDFIFDCFGLGNVLVL